MAKALQRVTSDLFRVWFLKQVRSGVVTTDEWLCNGERVILPRVYEGFYKEQRIICNH